MCIATGSTSSHLRAGVRVSAISIAWTVAACVASVAIGVATSSLVLVAFGCVGLLDAAGSIALLVHFRHALKHEAFSVRHERIALLVVTNGLITVAALTAAESVRRLVQSVHSSHTAGGMALAASSVVVLAVLARRKRAVGRAIPSHALVADGWLSLTGAALALVTLAGTALSGIGWWWADPAAAAAVAVGGLAIGVMLLRESRASS